MAHLIWLVVLLPLVGFVVNGLGRNHLSKNIVGIIGCGTILFSFIIVASMFFEMMNGKFTSEVVILFDWISVGSLSIPVAFQVDSLSVLMMLIVTGVGFLIHVYSVGYMHDDPGFARFFSYLNLFIFFMLMLVAGANYPILFVGWEGVGLCSYLLIGFWFKNQNFNDAAKKAFIVNRIGDLGFLLGMLLMFKTFGSLSFQEVFEKAKSFSIGDPVIFAITILLFIGAVGKSAQIPLFVWLPDAMAGPTPVSALIHAATMVTAGIYLVVRSNILFTLAPESMLIVGSVGLITALFAASIGLFQNDIKKVLAYSTVSQLGYLFLALGLGAYTGAMFHLTTHAFFKALLFLGAGSVIHGLHGEQDIRNMGAVKKYMPITFWTFLIATLAIAGIPPFSGFFSKDEILAHAFEHSPLLWGIALLGSLMTTFYMFRLFYLTFYGSFRGTEHQKAHIHESPLTMTVPLIVLAVLSAVGGFIGVPEVLGGSHSLNNFLSPIYEGSKNILANTPAHHLSHTTEYILMISTVLILIIVILTSRYLFVIKTKIPPGEEVRLSFIHNLIYKKYFVDELYEMTVIRMTNWASNSFFNFWESIIVDQGNLFIGNVTVLAGRTIRLIQTGSLAAYIFMMLIGVIFVLFINYYLI